MDTDRGADFRAALVATFRLKFVPLVVGANEEVLIMGAGAWLVLEIGVPNFFGGKEGSRAISGTGASAWGESRGTHSTEGLTPASVKNCWIFLTTAGG